MKNLYIRATAHHRSVLGASFLLLLASLALASTGKAATGSASFVRSDTTTQGTWQGVYGTDGYSEANGPQSLPAYVAMTMQNQLNHTWATGTTDSRALQTGSGSGRLAACWDNYLPFTFDVNFTDGNAHQFALYALDWDKNGRAETIQILDGATNAVLDSRSISGFTGGIYLVWNISGNVKVNVIMNAWPNAVVSGVFFGGGAPSAPGVSVSPTSMSLNRSQQQQFTAAATGGASQNVTWSISPSSGSISSSGLYTAPSTITGNQTVTVTATSATGPTATATVSLTAGATANFVGSDTTTQGNWQGKYGAEGYSVANASQSVPVYASFAPQNQANYTWNPSPSDPRALQTGSNASRIAACWYNYPTFGFDVNVTDGNAHQFALYALDWDSKQRAETIQIVDPSTNSVLDTRSVSGFSGGIYLIWSVSGHVRINVTMTAGPNAVISGAFFGGSGGNTGSTGTSSSGGTTVPAAAGTLSVNPASFNFGSVNIGSGVSQPISVTNSGTANVTISNVSVSGPGFDASGASGTVLSPGQSTTLNVTFTPATTASVTGSVTIPSNAANSPASISLSGTGVQPPAPSYSVVLTWVPGASSGVAGYNVYRSTAGGPFVQLTTALITGTTYTDTTVQAGQSYSYTVTSVDSNNVQSVDSNIAFAAIP